MKCATLAAVLYGSLASAKDVGVSIRHSTLKGPPVAGAEILLQRPDQPTLAGPTDKSGHFILGYSGAALDDDDAMLLIVRKQGFSTLVVRCPCNGHRYALVPAARITGTASSIRRRAESINRRGEEAHRRGNYLLAIRLFLDATDADPKYPKTYANLGVTFDRIGNTHESLDASRQCIALAQGEKHSRLRASCHYNIGRVYGGGADLREALKSFRAAENEFHLSTYVEAIAEVERQLGPAAPSIRE